MSYPGLNYVKAGIIKAFREKWERLYLDLRINGIIQN
jgi:hypothetical protein